MIRRERDELQNEVTKLERELSEQRKTVLQLEGQERRMSLQSESTTSKFTQQLKELEEMNDVLTVTSLTD